MYDCTIIVPVYNEENRITKFLNEIEKYKINYVFVSDGEDNTTNIISDYIEKNEIKNSTNVYLLSHPTRMGKGGAIIKGFRYALDNIKTPYIGYIDVDLSTDLPEILKMLDSIKNSKCDAIIGTRWAPGSLIITPQPVIRRILSRLLNIKIKLLFGLPYTDTQCGAKIFKNVHIKRIIDDLKTTGFEFDVELLWKLTKNGSIVCEFPLVWDDHSNGSKIKFIHAFEMFKNLILIRFFL